MTLGAHGREEGVNKAWQRRRWVRGGWDGGGRWRSWAALGQPRAPSCQLLAVRSLLSEVLCWPGERHPGPGWARGWGCNYFVWQFLLLLCKLRQGDLSWVREGLLDQDEEGPEGHLAYQIGACVNYGSPTSLSPSKLLWISKCLL